MTITEAAEYLGITKDTLYDYAGSGFVPAFKLGNRWRFSLQRIRQWVEEQHTKEQG